MSLKTRVEADRSRVFLRQDHFADWHTWNGIRFNCVTDDEAALKRKNNNVNDISWDNNTIDTLVYVREEDWPGRQIPNEHGFFDNKHMKVLQIQKDMGMLAIFLTSVSPKPVAATPAYDDY